jgi:hypothetical protein
MDVQQVTAGVVALLSGSRIAGRRGETESLVSRAIEGRGERIDGRDRLAVRQGSLRYSHARVRETSNELRVGQSRQTIAQTVMSAMNSLQAEVEEIGRLVQAVSEGEVPASQLGDVQNLIEAGLARIDEIVARTGYMGARLLTGEAVRVTTDVQSGTGFEVEYPDVSGEALGLGSIDVTSGDASESLGLVAEASARLAAAESRVGSELSAIEESLGGKVSELEGRLAEMRGREMLNAPEQTGWLTMESLGSRISVGELRAAQASRGLDAGMVATLLK